MTNTLKPVAIVGGLRIPFCRSNTAYSELSNKQMLTTVLNGMVERFALHGELIGEVNAGAVITHSRDWNLAREVVLSTALSASSPGVTMQQACGTSLQAAMMAAAKIATGQIDSAIAAGSDTVSDVPIVFNNKFSRRLVSLGKARNLKSKLAVFKGLKPRELAPVPPSVNEPRTLMSMGQHCELMAKTWNVSRAEQDQLTLQSHKNASAAYDAGFFDELIVACEGVVRDNNMRADSTLESLAGLRTVYDKSQAGTLTAGFRVVDGAYCCCQRYASASVHDVAGF